MIQTLYELLMLAMGRCVQDDYYLVPIDEKELPEEIRKRFATRIEDVLPLDDYCLLFLGMELSRSVI